MLYKYVKIGNGLFDRRIASHKKYVQVTHCLSGRFCLAKSKQTVVEVVELGVVAEATDISQSSIKKKNKS